MAAEGGTKSAAKMRWVIIAAAVGLGLFLYIRHNKQAAANAAGGSAVATNPNPTVPTYSLSASGMYNGGYTPYTIVNSGPTNMTSTFPGATGTPAVTTTSTNTITGAGGTAINGGQISQGKSTTVYSS
jgi:hypothetical protein